MEIDNLKTLLDALAAAGQPKPCNSPTEVLIVPTGHTAVPVEKLVEPFLEKPRRIKQEISLDRCRSFVEYVNEFKTDRTKILVEDPLHVTAVFDYHSNNPELDMAPTPGWCQHRATFVPVMTPEWQRFIAKNLVRMNQTALLEFIEENLSLIVTPPGAALLELVGSLEGKKNANFASATRLQNGQVRLVYNEEVTLKSVTNTHEDHVDFPAEVRAGISPFEGSPAYALKARMRYRIENRQLVFWFEIVDLHLVMKDAVEGIVAVIEEQTNITPLYGKV